MVRKLLFLFIVFTLTLSANIGKIVALKGDLTIVRDSDKIVGEVGSIILKNDEILTKSNGKAQLLFNDNTVITIGKNSVFKINEYLYDEQNKNYKTDFGLLKGTFRTITGKIGKLAPSKFKLNSKTSSIGIRGTQILSRMAVVGDRIVCVEGEIVITHLKTGQSIVIPAGQFVDLGVDTKVLKPQKLQQQDIQNMDDSTRFSLSDEKEVTLDDLDVVVSEPENVAWGEWNEEAEETEDIFVVQTDPNAVTNPDVIINRTGTAKYSGSFSGNLYDGGGNVYRAYSSNSTIDFNINYGTKQLSNGEISAKYNPGGTDTYEFEGTIKANGTGITLTQTSINPITPGSGSATFHGPTGSTIELEINDFEDYATGKKASGTGTATEQ